MTTTIGEHFNVTKKLTEDDKSFYRQWLDEVSSGYVEDFFYFDEAGKVIAKAQEDAAQGERVQAIPRAIVFRDLMERTLQKLADSAFPKASQLED
jgi:hypothetical protein